LQDQELKLNENASSSLVLNKILINERIKQFSCGKEHVLLLGSQSKSVYSFGIGTKGQLGHDKIENCFEPLVVSGLRAEIEVISAGGCGWHSAAIDSNGDCYAWGWNSHGQLGVLNEEGAFVPKPTKLSVLNELSGDEVKFRRVAMGSKHTVVMDLGGSLYSFGWNKYKQLFEDDDGEEIEQIDEPLRLNEFKVKDVKCGCWFTLTLSE
jgi:alpha-tubulin suppressor-like RCC1 family protein